MKRFHYIDENNKEALDLISLFDFAFDYKLNYDDILSAIKELDKHVKIESK